MKKLILATLLLVVQSALNLSVANELLCQQGDNSCTFVLLATPTNQLSVVNQNRAKQPMSPFSTFKIANSAIGLETGVIKDATQTLAYNKEKYPAQAWWPSVWKLPSYDLTTAYKFSVVPIYRQLATDIGDTNMKQYLAKFSYGDQDISSGLDQFWLNGSIQISAMEQVKFLQQLHENKLGLSETTMKALRKVMLATSGDDYKIYAKTGAGKVADGSMLGWYVGIVEKAETRYYFALNFNRPTYKAMKADRITMAMNHLKSAGVID